MLRLLALAALVACASAVTFGNLCQSNDECTDSESECRKVDPCTYGGCMCKEDYYMVGTACVEIMWKKVGESCDSMTQQCEGSSGNMNTVTCTNNVCVCYSGLVGSSGDDDCDWGDLQNYGGPCGSSTQCKAFKHYVERSMDGKAPEHSQTTATCIVGVCACSTGFAPNSGLDRCEAALKGPGESCTLFTECDMYTYSGLTCNAGTCKCVDGYTYFDYWSVYNRYEEGCLLADAIVDIAKGDACGTSHTASTTRCEKGLTCGYCPNDNTRFLCMDGAVHISISMVLLVGALFLQL